MTYYVNDILLNIIALLFWLLPQGFPHQSYVCISCLLHCCYTQTIINSYISGSYQNQA